ncbi:MAG: hypothetical protein BGN88_09235 [Clostridiales bacterium 43-6]|nr:MAG: hypothetical protein BGN88_09235 [Clostridiales bacterium 43-6]
MIIYNEEYILSHRALKKKERNRILIHSSVLGLALLSIVFSSGLFRPLIVAAIRFFADTDQSGAVQIFQNSMYLRLGVNIIITAFIFVLPYAIAAKLLRYRLSQLISFRTKINSPLPAFLVTLGFFAAGSILTILVNVIFSLFGLRPNAPDFGTPKTLWEFLFFTLATAVAPALFEEFAFRGVILNVLKPFGIWPAVLISSLLFGLMHGNFVQIPFAFCAGIGLAFLYIKTNSIWLCSLVHFLNNFLSLSMSYLDVPDSSRVFLHILLIVIDLYCGVIGYSIYCHRRKKLFGFRKTTSPFSSVTVTALIFLSPVMLFSIGLFFYDAIKTLLTGG